MLEHMIKTYMVQFEGLPEPVFYNRFYPLGSKNGAHSSYLWDSFHYAQHLKKDKDKHAGDDNYARWLAEKPQYRMQHEKDLNHLLDIVCKDTPDAKRGICTIPSSKRDMKNRVTELVDEALAKAKYAQQFDNLTRVVIRAKEKEQAHIDGNRSYDNAYQTLVIINTERVKNCDVIVVVDDILTTGTSFRALDERLRDAGFAGTIINFAFAYTFQSVSAEVYLEKSNEEVSLIPGKYIGTLTGPYHRSQEHIHALDLKANLPIKGIILDLDQTLIDDSIREILYEKDSNNNKCPYELYDGVEYILDLGVEYAIVSNRPEYMIKRIVSTPSIAFNPSWGFREHTPIFFSYPIEKQEGNSDYPDKYYKPHPKGVLKAIDHITSLYKDTHPDDLRIIGLGNTLADMLAYDAAGIESALALWGVPDMLKNWARDHWLADHVFETPADFATWCKDQEFERWAHENWLPDGVFESVEDYISWFKDRNQHKDDALSLTSFLRCWNTEWKSNLVNDWNWDSRVTPPGTSRADFQNFTDNLISYGYLEKRISADGKTRYVPTPKGQEIGILLKTKDGSCLNSAAELPDNVIEYWPVYTPHAQHVLQRFWIDVLMPETED